MVPVNVYVLSDAAQPAPISGVRVGAYNPTTYQLMAAATTDAQGRASFALDGGGYELRFFKTGVLFENPLACTVVEPEDPEQPNGFGAVGSIIDFGASLDPRLCRCVGRFVNFSNQPMADVLVKILTDPESGAESPKVLDSQMVGAVSQSLRTDENGRVIVDLVRGAELRLMFAGEEDRTWPFKVPDRASANLIDLVHPQPVAVLFNPPALVTTVGQVVTADVSLLFSDFQSTSLDLARFIDLTNVDPEVAAVGISSTGVLSVCGKKLGLGRVTATLRTGLLPKRIPIYDLVSQDLVISVT